MTSVCWGIILGSRKTTGVAPLSEPSMNPLSLAGIKWIAH
jgi:hypothetical protein